MARKIRAVYGDDAVQLDASNGRFELRISDPHSVCDAFVRTATSKAEMVEAIKEVEDTLARIRWELDTYRGFLYGFAPEEGVEE